MSGPAAPGGPAGLSAPAGVPAPAGAPPAETDLSRSFAGLVVVDLSQGVAGPHATMLLAAYGAEVIKVEPPEGDWARTLGPRHGDLTAHFCAFNLRKRSVALDLKTPEGRTALDALIDRADVFVESFRPGVADRLGCGPAAVRARRPGIVYASLSAFGQTGPYRERGGVDALIQGFSGLMVTNQGADGRPRRINMTAIDVMSGLYLFTAISAAVARQRATGEGAYIDASLMQSAGAFQSAKIIEAHLAKGEAQPLYMPAGFLRTRDGGVSLSTMRQEHYAALCNALGRADLLTDPRFAELGPRIEHGEALMAELERETSRQGTDDVLALLHRHGVFVERVQSYVEWLGNEQVLAAGAYGWVEHGPLGTVPVVHLPGVPVDSTAVAPAVGRDTAQVLSSLKAPATPRSGG